MTINKSAARALAVPLFHQSNPGPNDNFFAFVDEVIKTAETGTDEEKAAVETQDKSLAVTVMETSRAKAPK